MDLLLMDIGTFNTMRSQNTPGNHSNESVREQATEWFARLRADDCTEAARREFRNWLVSSAAHAKEYEGLQKMWADLDGLNTRLPDPSAESGIGWSGVRTISHRWTWMAAAALLLLFLGGSWFYRFGDFGPMYVTAKGEQRTVTLSDGTRVWMNTDTALTVEISPELRKVVLERGEALFDVRHDARPFDVIAGNGRIRDLGTQFNVYRGPQGVSVSVLDGTVEVSLEEGARQAVSSRILSRGHAVSYDTRGVLSAVKTADENMVAAWRDGKFVFDEAPLSEVIHQMNRYWDGDIRINDSRLEKLTLSGVFRIDDREGFLEAIGQVLPVVVEKVDDSTVVLSARHAAAASSSQLR